jgi:hypothetical protein
MAKGSTTEKQVITSKDVGTLSMGEVEPAKPEINDDLPHLYERVDALIAARGFEKDEKGNWPEGVLFERRQRHREAPVFARLNLPNGDSIGAQGATTEEAVDNLEQRLAEWPK